MPYTYGVLVVCVLLLAPVSVHGDSTEPYNSGWIVRLDNDGFNLLNRDQQYTGGFSLELAGHRAKAYPWSLDPALSVIDRLTRFDAMVPESKATQQHSFLLGLAAFTPEDVASTKPIHDDHPYANIVFIGNSRATIHNTLPLRYQSSLFVGVLGTAAGREFQNQIHDLGDTERAQGWDNQISAGGELTAMYAVSRSEIISTDYVTQATRYSVQTNVFGSVGTVTEAGVGGSVRWGRYGDAWWGFDNGFGEYMDVGHVVAKGHRARPRGREWFFWLGVHLRARLYNALLEGQFRDSAVTYDRSELRPLIVDSVAGVTTDIGDTGLRASFELHHRSREIDEGRGALPIWGRFVLSRKF